jgi:uroporphyrinogen-III decarboxylase
MNSKERVRAAVARRAVDKIPLGFYVVDYDIIEQVIGHETYVRNKVKSQIAFWEGRRDEVVESYKKDTVEFYRTIGICDVICFKEAPLVPPKGYASQDPPRQVNEDIWRDLQGRVYKVSHISNEFVIVEDPTVWQADYTVDQFQEEVADVPPDPSIFEAVDHIVAELGQDRYIAGSSGGLGAFVLLGNMERGLLEYALHPEVVKAAIDHQRRRGNAMDKYYIRPGQDGVLLEEDVSGTTGPLISPKMYREFCYPALCSRIQSIKSFGKQVLMHNCGNNRLLMAMFAEAGVECYQSLQTNADMDVASLQAEWGHAMAFWGGVATEILIEGTADDVRRNVRETMVKASPRGGFILGPSHSIAKGVKYDNFMALLDEFAQWRERF